MLSQDLISGLRKDIIQGKYARGYKLTEQDICAKYNVSRTPVRESLRLLETEGLIEAIPNRGAFVSGFSRQDIRDIFELRKSCEIQSVKWAAERITDGELDELDEVFGFMEFYTQKKDIGKMSNINISFHRAIYNAAHSRMLRHLLYSYQEYTEYVKKSQTFNEDYLPLVFEEHTAVYSAIKARDAVLGALAMERHMDKSIERQFGI